jgi:HAD superfamily phosphoserine phosphatase-like hydrolase
MQQPAARLSDFPEIESATWIVVDVDNVLLDGQLGMILAKRLARGFRALKTVAKMSTAVVRYRAKRAPIDDVVAAACSLFEGEPADEMAAKVRAVVERDVLPALRPAVRDWIQIQVAAGRPVALVSTAPFVAVKALAEALGAVAARGSDVEVTTDGRLTARPIPPLCYGDAKVAVACAIGAELGHTLDTLLYLADSKSDLPLLRAAGFPVCVNPTSEVRAEAADHGWPIVTL